MAENREVWDALIRATVREMTDEGATFEQVINRFVTFVGVHLVTQHGVAGAAEKFREFANHIDAGAFSDLKIPGPKN